MYYIPVLINLLFNRLHLLIQIGLRLLHPTNSQLYFLQDFLLTISITILVDKVCEFGLLSQGQTASILNSLQLLLEPFELGYFLIDIFTVLQILMLIDFNEFNLVLDVGDGLVLLCDQALQMTVLFVLFSLGEHEGAEFLQLGLEVCCVLVFLELGKMLCGFHIFVNKNYQQQIKY